MTATASVPLKEIFDSAGVVAARIVGGLRPPTNSTSHLPLEVCKDAVYDNGHCWGRTDAEVLTNLKIWVRCVFFPDRNLPLEAAIVYSTPAGLLYKPACVQPITCLSGGHYCLLPLSP
jgi:hypothetical protein